MRLLHFADLHIGVESYGRPDPETGLNTRLQDFLRAFDELAEQALARQVDAVIFAGDAYKSREPSQTHQREFARRVARIAAAGIPVYLLVGNHDVPAALHRAHALEIFPTLAVENVHVGDRLGTQVLQTRSGPLQVTGVPWPTPAQLLTREDYRGKSIVQVNEIVSDLIRQQLRAEASRIDPALPAVLTAHLAMDVRNVRTASESSMVVGQFPVFFPETVALREYDYVALGHHHPYQVLRERPPVVYAGSMQRVDFGEEKDPKGFVVVELDPALPQGERCVSHELVEVMARRFVTVKVTPSAQDPTDEVVERLRRAGIEDAIVRVVVELRADQQRALRSAALDAELARAHHARIQVVLVDAARTRVAVDGSVEALGPLDLLRLYFDEHRVPSEAREELERAAQGLLDEADLAGIEEG